MSQPLSQDPSRFQALPPADTPPPPPPPDRMPSYLHERLSSTPPTTPGILQAKSWSQTKAKAREAISHFFSISSPTVLSSQDQKRLVRYLKAKLYFGRAYDRLSMSDKKEHKQHFDEAASAYKELLEAFDSLMRSSKNLTELAAVLQNDLPVFKNQEKLIIPEAEDELRGQYDRYSKLLDSLQESLEGWDKEDKRVPAEKAPFLSELQGKIGETPEELQIPKQKLSLGLIFERLKALFPSELKVKLQELLASVKTKLADKKLPPLEGDHQNTLQHYLETYQALMKVKMELISLPASDPKSTQLKNQMKQAQEAWKEAESSFSKDTVANLHFKRMLDQLTEYIEANSAYAHRYQQLAMNQNAPAERLRRLFAHACQAKERADRAASVLENDPKYGPIVQNNALVLMQLVKERIQIPVALRLAQSQQEAAKDVQKQQVDEQKRQADKQLAQDIRMGKVPAGVAPSEARKASPKPYLEKIQEAAQKAGPLGNSKRLLAIAKMELEGLQHIKRESSRLDEASIANKQREVAPSAQYADIMQLIESDAKRTELRQLKEKLESLERFPMEESFDDFLQRVAQVAEVKQQILALDPSYAFTEPEMSAALQPSEEETKILQSLSVGSATPSEVQLPAELTEEALFKVIERIVFLNDASTLEKQFDALDTQIKQRSEADQKLYRGLMIEIFKAIR